MRIASSWVVLLATSACSLAPGHDDSSAPILDAPSEKMTTHTQVGRISPSSASAIPPGKLGLDPLVSIYPGSSFAAPFAVAREDSAHASTSFRVTGVPGGVGAVARDGFVSFTADVFAAPTTAACTLEEVDAKGTVVAAADFTLTIVNPTFIESARNGIGYLPATKAYATTFAQEADGSLLTLGMTYDADFSHLPCVIEHHFADGRFDLAFGSGGAAQISLPLETIQDIPRCFSLAVQKSGAIVVGGITPEASFVARLKPNGELDETFGDVDPDYFPNRGGRMILARSLGEAYSIMSDASDRIWIAGTRYDDGALYLNRLDASGNDDPTFVAPALSDAPSAIVQTRDGSIYLGGYLITRLTSDGAIDSSFGDGGSTALPWGSGWVMGMALSPNDDVIVAGHALAPPDCNGGRGISGFLAKISDGNGLDPSFGTPALGCGFAVSSVSVAANNRILVSGTDGWNETAGAMLFAESGAATGAFPLPIQLSEPNGPPFYVGMYGGAENADGTFTFLLTGDQWQSMFVELRE